MIKDSLENEKNSGWTVMNYSDLQEDSFVDNLYQRTTQGYLIKGVLNNSEVEALRKSFENWDKELEVKLPFGKTLGKTLMGSDPNLEYYLRMSELFNRNLSEHVDFSFQNRLIDLMNRLSGGRKTLIPSHGENVYSLANVRDLSPHKGGLHAHIGNEFIGQYPELLPLAQMADLKDQLSYFVVLQKPEIGGGLTVYDLNWEETPSRFIDNSILYYSEERNAEVEKYNSFTIQPEEGDMILFSGGTVWHRVEDIKGARSRITIGGFSALSKDDKSLYIWS